MARYSLDARFTRALLAAGAGMAIFTAMPAHAFSDDEARQAVLDLRTRTDALAGQLSAAQRTILDQSGQLQQLQDQVATLRGQNEDLNNQVTLLQRSEKDYYSDLDSRLKKFEPQQTTVDGVEGTVQPGETDTFNAALTQFRNGDFKGSAAAMRDFLKRYPDSPYKPSANYWLGNALYALRDYKGSTAALQQVVSNFPTHPRAPEAMLAIATNQQEQGQKAVARRTLEQLVSQYPSSESAQSAQARLQKLR
ncbi:MAG: tol-pal system protein YbgF [Janthinobacterium lividum]